MLPDPFADEAPAPLSLINTTPLVDVMLVLLIIFLITVPVVTAAIPVHLPRAEAPPAPPPPDAVTLTITRDGALYWNDTRLDDAAALHRRLASLAARTPPPPLRLRGDGETRYAVMARVIAAARAAGLTQIGFLTLLPDPPTSPPR